MPKKKYISIFPKQELIGAAMLNLPNYLEKTRELELFIKERNTKLFIVGEEEQISFLELAGINNFQGTAFEPLQGSKQILHDIDKEVLDTININSPVESPVV